MYKGRKRAVSSRHHEDSGTYWGVCWGTGREVRLDRQVQAGAHLVVCARSSFLRDRRVTSPHTPIKFLR